MRVGRILGESNGILKLLIPRCVAFTRTTMRMPTRSTAPRAPREGKAVARRCDAVRCGGSDHVLSRCVLVLMSSYVQWPRLRSPHCLERWQSTRLHERPPRGGLRTGADTPTLPGVPVHAATNDPEPTTERGGPPGGTSKYKQVNVGLFSWRIGRQPYLLSDQQLEEN